MLVSPLTMFPVVIFNEMHAKSFGLFFRIRQLDTSIRCQILSNSLIIVVRSLTLDCQSQVETKFYLVLESLSAMDLGVKVFVGLGLVVVADLCLYKYTTRICRTLSIIEKEVTQVARTHHFWRCVSVGHRNGYDSSDSDVRRVSFFFFLFFSFLRQVPTWL